MTYSMCTILTAVACAHVSLVHRWMQLYAGRLLGGDATADGRRYLYRALQFQRTVIGTPLLSDLGQMRQPQPGPEAPWSFWTGSIESAVLLWTELLYRGAPNATLTGWQPRL